jgi:hypothetical protein
MKSLLTLNLLYIFISTTAFAQVLYLPKENLNETSIEKSFDEIDKHKLLLLNTEKNLQKLSTDLLQLYDANFLPSGTTLEEHLSSMEKTSQFAPNKLYTDKDMQVKKGKVYVYIFFNKDYQINAADNLILQVTDRDEKNRMIVAWVEIDKLPDIAALQAVRTIRSVLPPVLNAGSVTTEGDAVHRTSNVRSTFNKDGTGIKIGVISDGVQNRSSAQATGDLPPDGSGLTVLSAGTGDEGTAMLEIIHDMVPGAQLYFHSYGTNTTQFNAAIDNLVAAGCKIICDDVGWITEPFFEDGTVASHVATVLASNDVIYVSSAGNAGYTHYQGDFFPLSGYTTLHDFNEGGGSSTHYLYVQLSPGETVTVVLQWNDQFGSSSNDYDLELRLNSNGSLVASSNGFQTGTQDPLEAFSYTNPSKTQTRDYQIRVINYNGLAAVRTLEVYFYPETGSYYINNIKPQDGIFGHPAVNGVIATGAVDQATPTVIEGFSSQGPSTIAFPTSEVRQKPDIVGTDFVSVTGAGGFPSTFGGTSAAAPHIVSILAQAWSYNLSQTANQVRQLLYDWAVDLGTSGFDNIYGYGRGDALNIFNGALPVELSSFSASSTGSAIKLSWRTETESKNYGFEVERKVLNGQSSVGKFETVGFVPGNGNSNSPKDYTFTDNKVGSGKYNYRLKQIDIDGSINYSKIIEVDLIAPLKYELSQNYPNPFNPVTTINFSLPEAGNVKLTLYNLLGEKIKTLVNEFKEEGVHTVNFNANDLQSGLYIYKIEAGLFVQTRKMMLLK